MAVLRGYGHELRRPGIGLEPKRFTNRPPVAWKDGRSGDGRAAAESEHRAT